jgi:cation:H+ antiporter
MILNLIIFIAALGVVVKGSMMATRYASRLAESFHLSKYVVGFIIVAMISILPETLISINSAIAGIPSFGFGMLLGSNVADLTLIFAIIIFYTKRDIKVESGILKNRIVYPFLLLLPLILGFDGHLSRKEGLALIIAGGAFYYLSFRNGARPGTSPVHHNGRYKSFFMLLVSMAILLVGAHATVVSATAVAQALGISTVLIGILVVGLGTTIPELFFSLRSIKKREDSLAIGDLLGTVLADATIVIGIVALISPFSFPGNIVYVTGGFMVAASLLLFFFMRSGKVITRKEAYILFAFWITFVLVEFMINR